MELASPSVDDAVDAAVSAGARVVTIAPYFLSRFDTAACLVDQSIGASRI